MASSLCVLCFTVLLGLFICTNGETFNIVYPDVNDVVINEVFASGSEFWVELYNADSNNFMDVNGYYLKFLPKLPERNVLKINSTTSNDSTTVIPPNGFLVVNIPYSWRQAKEQIILVDPSQEVNFDVFSFGGTSLERLGGAAYFRQPDGGFWSEFKDFQPTPGQPNSAPFSAKTSAGAFEIHVFNVGQGDSQLIRFPSGFTILVDVFESNWNSNNGAEYVAARIKDITGGSYIDVGVLSHLHLDHIGYAGYGGFWHLIEKGGIQFGKIVDRDAGEWIDSNSDGDCDPDTEIDWNVVGTFSGTAQNWLCYATNPANSKIYPIREVAQLCSTTQINPPDSNSFVKIVTVDGRGATMVDGVTPVTGDYSSSSVPPSENDYSLGLLIGFGNLRYVTLGDLDGDYASSSFGYTYNNIEAVVAPRVGKVDLYHVNHHGSSHSSSPGFLSVLKPTVSLISCGVDNSYGHPDQTVLDRLLDYGDVFLTSDCDTSRDYASSQRLNKDIYVYSQTGSSFYVRGSSGDVRYTAGTKSNPPCN